jgi:hypothetical protein
MKDIFPSKGRLFHCSYIAYILLDHAFSRILASLVRYHKHNTQKTYGQETMNSMYANFIDKIGVLP